MGWSRTQNHITLSSAEAELIALVKRSAEILGVTSMLRDFGVESEGVVYVDSSAALAIARRKGAGKMLDQPGRSNKLDSGVRGTRTLAGLLKRREKSPPW